MGAAARSFPALLAASALCGQPPAGRAAPGAVSLEPHFEEVAAGSGIDFVHFNGMTGELYFAEMMGAGGALVDYDGDGDLDVYLVQGAALGADETPADALFPPRDDLPLSDRLYRNDSYLEPAGDGALVLRFADVTAASGLAATGYGMGVAAGDYDNDGWIDLYLTNLGENQLLRNLGDGTWRDVTAATGTGDPLWSVPAAFVDYDGDGWLDLFVGNYVDFRVATHKPCASATGAFDYCSPLAYRPEPDRLFHNRGDGTFEEVSAHSGIQAEDGGALGAVAADFDRDGRLDLLVANDGTPNFLWHNRGDGTFVNDAPLAGCAVNEAGQPEANMGVIAADLDGNGAEDLFVSHLTRETNTLYLNDGKGFFTDASRRSGLGPPSWPFTGFGIAVFDYDLDGWLDLFVANGAVRHIEELVRRGDPYPLHQTSQLFHNQGDGTFVEVTSRAGDAFARSEVSRGVAVGDVDEDGTPDFLLTNNAGPARLFRNRTADGRERHWLRVRVRHAESDRDLLGSEVTVTRADGRALLRRVQTDGTYASAGDPRVLFGLAEDGAAQAVRVAGLGARPLELRGPPVDRTLTFWVGAEPGGGRRRR